MNTLLFTYSKNILVHLLTVNIKNCLEPSLVKQRMIVDDSWFSPNYHQQLSFTGQTAKEDRDSGDDSSPAVAQAKSREQLVPSSVREKMWTLNGVP